VEFKKPGQADGYGFSSDNTAIVIPLSGPEIIFDCQGHTLEGLVDINNLRQDHPELDEWIESSSDYSIFSAITIYGKTGKLTIRNCIIKNFYRGIGYNNHVDHCMKAINLGGSSKTDINSNLFTNNYPNSITTSIEDVSIQNNVICVTDEAVKSKVEADEIKKKNQPGYPTECGHYETYYSDMTLPSKDWKYVRGNDCDLFSSREYALPEGTRVEKNICDSYLCTEKCHSWDGKTLPDGTTFSQS
jgi:hypothetical protein